LQQVLTQTADRTDGTYCTYTDDPAYAQMVVPLPDSSARIPGTPAGTEKGDCPWPKTLFQQAGRVYYMFNPIGLYCHVNDWATVTAITNMHFFGVLEIPTLLALPKTDAYYNKGTCYLKDTYWGVSGGRIFRVTRGNDENADPTDWIGTATFCWVRDPP
jgi:hypothetical protein